MFDALYAGGRSLMGADLLTRKRVVSRLVRNSRVVRYTDHLAGGRAALYRAAKAAGLEGIVSKRADSTYRPSVRSRDWQKVKCYHRYTFTVAAISRSGARLSDEAGEHVGTVPHLTRPAPGGPAGAGRPCGGGPDASSGTSSSRAADQQDGGMHGNLFKLRGYASGRTCPACGSETMRTEVYGALDTLLSAVKLRRRWCRRCLRQWIAPRHPQRPPQA